MEVRKILWKVEPLNRFNGWKGGWIVYSSTVVRLDGWMGEKFNSREINL